MHSAFRFRARLGSRATQSRLPLFPQNQTHAPQRRRMSFDQLVGPDKQRRRDGEAERSCRLEVYHKLKLRRLLDG